MADVTRNLSYQDLSDHFGQVELAYITFLNHGQQEDLQKFSQLMDQYIGLLLSSLMADRTYQGASDALFAGILYRINRRMDTELAKPMFFEFEGLSLNLAINPLLFYLYYEKPAQMLAGLKQMCYHVVFDYLTKYDWAYQEERTGKMMSVAMEVAINQYLQDLPGNSVGLDWVQEMTGDAYLDSHRGALYYYEAMLAVDQDPKKQGHQRLATTFNRMKGSGEMSDLYEQFTGSFDPRQASDLRADKADQLAKEMRKNPSMQQAIPQAKNNDLHRKIVNGLVRDSYRDLSEEMRKNLSNNLDVKIAQITKRRSLNWRDIIQRGLGTTVVPYRLSKNRMNRRQPYRIDLPGRTLDTASRLVAFFDTSASQNEGALAYSLGELANIQETLHADVWVVQVDTQVTKVEKLNRQTLKEFDFKGRGGTSFAPAFEWLHQMGFTDQDTVAVYFTDGYGDDNFERYGFTNMYWVLTDADPSEPVPLSTDGGGKILYLRGDEKYNRDILSQLTKRR
ncbi:Predicted metal-dependent peptidase [Aerococcus urinaehominis]|nr:VWA-like domain-containing protein [Aerococcus urinaehominis]SDL97705.1 Predicted metal-dependent peptidase [Aerococcus urinaehominis]